MRKDDSERFTAYLKDTAGIFPKYIPHYQRWVDKYISSKESNHPNREQALERFHRLLERTLESWKVNQALNAVRHYWFCKDQQKRKEKQNRNDRQLGQETLPC
jgi:hypothetical protein